MAHKVKGDDFGICTVCEKEVALGKISRLIRSHGIFQNEYCAGSNRPPADMTRCTSVAPLKTPAGTEINMRCHLVWPHPKSIHEFLFKWSDDGATNQDG